MGVLPEEVDVAGAEDNGVEGLGDDGDTWGAVRTLYQLEIRTETRERRGERGGNGPSELLLRWMAKMRMHFDRACVRSARIRHTFI